MTTLLILGSKADPALPPRAAYDDLACANASGFSAARHGLPTPAYTVMTAVLTSGKAEDDHSLQALRGAVEKLWQSVSTGDAPQFTAMMQQGREYLAGRVRND